MKFTFKIFYLAALAAIPSLGQAEHENKILFKDAVLPILNAKCASCHGEEKQKGKLRVDSMEAILKGGNEGASVVAGKVEDSPLMQRVHLPLDDDDHMPPEDEEQLTKEEAALLDFWIKSGAKADATVASLKPAEAEMKVIAAVFSNLPKAPADDKKDENKLTFTPEQQKLSEATIAKVEEAGASLMPIAQDTPALRFSALNVAKEYDDKQLEMLSPVADQIRWVDLARTKVTDNGLAQIGKMKHLTRLHLENTEITDKGLDHLKGLAELEYLNLYGTKVSDAGIMKLAANKNLKKLFVWQSQVTEEGAKKLAAAINGIDVNTGWKAAAAEPVKLAAVTPTEKKEEPKKPTPVPPAKKPEPTKPEPTKPEPKKPETPKPADPKPTGTPFDKALAELTSATETAQKEVEAAKVEVAKTAKVAADANKAADDAKAKLSKAEAVANQAKEALNQLLKAIEATKK